MQVYAGRDPRTGKERRIARTIRGTRSDADHALRQLIREVEAGQHRGDDPTVAELAEQWHAFRSPDWTPRTCHNYRSVLDRWVLPHLGTTRARKVTTRTLDQAYANMVADGAGAQTVRKAHTIIRAMFTQAAKWDIVAANPAVHATPPKIANLSRDLPEPAAVAAMLAALADEDPRMAAFVRLAVTTGARRSELCALRWDDIDLERGAMTITRAVDGFGGIKTTKTGRNSPPKALDPSTVAAVARWRAALAQVHLAARAGTPEWVFPRMDTLAEPVRPDVMSHAWGKVRDRHGLQGVRLHDLRHFVASRMLASGVDVRTVASRLGQNPATTLRVYAHLIPEADRQAADDLGRLLDNG